MAKLAFYTFAILHESGDHPKTKGFVDRVPFVYESAENSKGFVDRAASRTMEGNNRRWGESSVMPRFFSQDQHSPHRNHQPPSPYGKTWKRYTLLPTTVGTPRP